MLEKSHFLTKRHQDIDNKHLYDSPFNRTRLQWLYYYKYDIILTNPKNTGPQMALGKQAKTLSENQIKLVLKHLETTQDKTRNQVMFLLSVDAGLRAKEIASVTWSMITESSGNLTDAIRLEDFASKGKSGGIVYISKRLKAHLHALDQATTRSGTIIKSRNGTSMSAQVVTNWFFNLYRELGMEGCSSHSGRRTAITRWARNITAAGGSIRDVQSLARHSSLAMTQRYIEISEDAMKKVVG